MSAVKTTTAPSAPALNGHQVAPSKLPTRHRRAKHWLDDPLTDYGLFIVGAVIQVWSTFHMFELAHWAYGSWFSAIVNVLMYDAIALIAARVGADDRNGTRKTTGIAVRGLAWCIAASTFAFVLSGNFLSHWIFENGVLVDESLNEHKPLVRIVLGSLPVLLLLASLVLRTRMKANKDKVIRMEQEQERREQEEARLAMEAEQRRREQEARDAEERRRQEELAEKRRQDELQREREQREAELRRAQIEAEARKAEAEAREKAQREEAVLERLAQAAAAPPKRNGQGSPNGQGGTSGGETKMQRVKRLWFEHWARGENPEAAAIDKLADTRNYASKGRRQLEAEGWGPGNVPPEYQLDTPTDEIPVSAPAENEETAAENEQREAHLVAV